MDGGVRMRSESIGEWEEREKYESMLAWGGGVRVVVVSVWRRSVRRVV